MHCFIDIIAIWKWYDYRLLWILSDKILKVGKNSKYLWRAVNAFVLPSLDFKYFKSNATHFSSIWLTLDTSSNWDPVSPMVFSKTIIWRRTLVFSSNTGKLTSPSMVLQYRLTWSWSTAQGMLKICSILSGQGPKNIFKGSRSRLVLSWGWKLEAMRTMQMLSKLWDNMIFLSEVDSWLKSDVVPVNSTIRLYKVL